MDGLLGVNTIHHVIMQLNDPKHKPRFYPLGGRAYALSHQEIEKVILC